MEKTCSLLVHLPGEAPSPAELKKSLEKGTEFERIEALKRVITLTINGEPLPGVLMCIIRFVLPSRNHTLKKLLLLYLEAVEKVDANGRLRPEMILVCNALRNDLTHPNEFIRGSACRFLCHMREAELLEPLVPSVRDNLEHRHAYVRRNAVLAIYSIYKHFESLIPDAPELIFDFLSAEADASCKRNAFVMLLNTSPEKATEYLGGVLDEVEGFSDVLQFIVVELIRKLVRQNPQLRGKYIRVIYGLLKSSSAAVRFEAAATLLVLSSAPSALRAAASTYIDILCTESDNNVKLIVLDRINAIKQRHPKVMQDLLLDVLRALESPELQIRRKTLMLSLDLVTLKNVDEVVQVFKKEIARTQAKELEKQGEYRQMLIHAIHTCAVNFPDVASKVVHLLMEFLGDDNAASAVDVVLFVREVIETYPDLRASIVDKLIIQLEYISVSKVFRATLWIIGEYAQGKEELKRAYEALKAALGPPPFVAVADEDEEDEKTPETEAAVENKVKEHTGPKLNADGTYASQSALVPEVSTTTTGVTKEKLPPLRALLVAGDFFLGTVIATTLAKLTLRLTDESIGFSAPINNKLVAQSILVMVAILRLGRSSTPPHPIDHDSAARIYQCIRALTQEDALLRDILLNQSRISFTNMLRDMAEHNKRQSALTNTDDLTTEAEAAAAAALALVQADDCISVRQLRPRARVGGAMDDIDDMDLSRATGEAELVNAAHESKLNRVVQLTGFSDPIFAEAYVTVHQYDIVLEVTMVNQTGDTLQNVCLELATLGDLKLVERPQYLTIAAGAKQTLKASIKVSSTETGIIFGNIVYDIAGVAAEADRNCVILSDIHIDIMDYIQPASCSDAKFRSMWSEFEWENKVAVNTNITTCDEFLSHIVESTNMRCLTPTSSLAGKCGFIAANLYAKSIFGEDALANISIEKQADGKIGGSIRIRAKAQGIALSLGDKVTMSMRA